MAGWQQINQEKKEVNINRININCYAVDAKIIFVITIIHIIEHFGVIAQQN